MSSVTKSFSKDIDQLEDTLYALNKNKISLQIDLGKVKSELKAAEKQFEQTQSAADGLKLELIQANYDNIARNLEAVTRAVGETDTTDGGRAHKPVPHLIMTCLMVQQLWVRS